MESLASKLAPFNVVSIHARLATWGAMISSIALSGWISACNIITLNLIYNPRGGTSINLRMRIRTNRDFWWELYWVVFKIAKRKVYFHWKLRGWICNASQNKNLCARASKNASQAGMFFVSLISVNEVNMNWAKPTQRKLFSTLHSTWLATSQGIPNEKVEHGDWVVIFMLKFRFCPSNRLLKK